VSFLTADRRHALPEFERRRRDRRSAAGARARAVRAAARQAAARLPARFRRASRTGDREPRSPLGSVSATHWSSSCFS